MKKMKHILLSVLTVFAFSLVLKLPVHALSLSMEQTACTPTSVTLRWNSINDTNAYRRIRVTKYVVTTDSGYTKTLPGNVTSCTLKRLPQIFDDHANIVAYYTETYPDGSSNAYKMYYNHVDVCTQPPNIAKKHFIIEKDSINSSNNTGKVSVNIEKPIYSYNVHLQVYQGKKCYINDGNYWGTFTVRRNTVYKYRVKYTIKNYDSDKTYESAKWSPWRYFVIGTAKMKATSNKKGVSITLQKIPGVTSYKVYVSSHSDSGFKLSKTIKLGSKKKGTFTITKYCKARGYNYIKLVPQIQGYGPSDYHSTGDIKL